MEGGSANHKHFLKTMKRTVILKLPIILSTVCLPPDNRAGYWPGSYPVTLVSVTKLSKYFLSVSIGLIPPAVSSGTQATISDMPPPSSTGRWTTLLVIDLHSLKWLMWVQKVAIRIQNWEWPQDEESIQRRIKWWAHHVHTHKCTYITHANTSQITSLTPTRNTRSSMTCILRSCFSYRINKQGFVEAIGTYYFTIVILLLHCTCSLTPGHSSALCGG